MQRFDNLATKFLRLISMSQPPKQGVFGTPGGGVGIAVNSNTVTQFGPPNALSVNGAIPVVGGDYVITKAGVLADTLAAPVPGTQDGMTLVISSATAFAHTITATGLLQTGTASVNVATFAAQAGAGLTLMAYNGKWIVQGAVGITFS